MLILIDGYNLMHVFGIRDEHQRAALSRARKSLLNRLAKALPAEHLPQTTVVFDAKNPPPGAPPEMVYRGITVLFAVAHDEADDLIEELIGKHSTPKKLVVVSSDRRIQIAATRRKAIAQESEAWYDSLFLQPPPSESDPTGKQIPAESPHETDSWIEAFSSDSTEPPPAKPPPETQADEPFENPFPPGYGEDVNDEWD